MNLTVPSRPRSPIRPRVPFAEVGPVAGGERWDVLFADPVALAGEGGIPGVAGEVVEAFAGDIGEGLVLLIPFVAPLVGLGFVATQFVYRGKLDVEGSLLRVIRQLMNVSRG